jgi:predicted HTH domain antitoxin
MRYERLDKATTVRKIMEIGISEWRKDFAIQLLQRGKASFNKAAEIAKLSAWEFAELLRERRVEWVEATIPQTE